MGELRVNGIRLHLEEHGEGVPILCIHGTSSSALLWRGAVPKLARFGRVIAYDRRGCGRSERPRPYARTSVAEHAGDAAALIDALGAAPAIVIGRSYGGEVALDLAVRHPGHVRALVLLEPASPALSPGLAAWAGLVAGRLRDVAGADGPDAVGRAFIAEVLGPDAWDALPEEVRRTIAANSPAILAELDGDWLAADRAALAGIDRPTLLVSAADSPAVFREADDALAAAMPAARRATVEGGHLVDPAGPEVLSFLDAIRAT
jgi:pimeloyl-ACP methyl ester carboxylesterase